MKKLFLLLLIITAISSCRKKHWKCDEEVSYKNDIQPLFDAHCSKCHAYKTYSDAKALANGNLKSATIDERRMPPQGEKSLTLKERKKIYCWIESGALDN